jgi:dienelactone hydrolase
MWRARCRSTTSRSTSCPRPGRNHGESGRKWQITYGLREANDVQGALAYLRARPEVDNDRIGLLGCSMGANAAIYAAAASPPVKAILAVQATRVTRFNHNYSKDEFGPIGPYLLKPVDPLYRLMGAPRLREEDPAQPAAQLTNTVVKYVQATGDPWGDMGDTEDFVAATPNATLVRYAAGGRYEGYRYVNEEVGDVAAFFGDNV